MRAWIKQHGDLLMAALLAIGLQVQFTLFRVEGSYSGLRLAALDIILPLIGIVILISLMRRRSTWPQWRLPSIPLWLASMTGVLVLSYAHTYWIFDVTDQWALLNKLCGWFVILAYFYLAGWIGTNYPARSFYLFCVIFFGVFAGQALYETLPYLINDLRIYSLPRYDAIKGFVANRNVFALFLLLSCTFFYLFHHYWTKRWQVFALSIFWLLVPLCFLHNASRSGMIAGCLLFIAALIYSMMKKHARQVIVLLLLGFTLLVVMYHGRGGGLLLVRSTALETITQMPGIEEIEPSFAHDRKIGYVGDNVRLSVLHSVLPMIRENPVFGWGLGSVRLHQLKEQGHIVDIMDNTSLWLIAETGLAGFAVFAVFYILLFGKFIALRRTAQGVDKDLFTFMLVTLVIFAFMSLFHELLYTRQLWILLGFALAVPKTHPGGYTSPAARSFP